MQNTHLRKAAKHFLTELGRFDARFGLCLHGWNTRHRFSALVLFFVLPATCLAKRRTERRLGTDLYVMF